MGEGESSYETHSEKLFHEGKELITYGIYLNNGKDCFPILHDVTLYVEKASELCGLLNRNLLEPEQARYVLEDYVLERYIA